MSVNGKFVREHHGGFTRWETDITSFVRIGKKNEIQLAVVDRLDEISYASGYAHHPIGGILRDVTLFALPESHLYDIGVETHLDSLYQDADLRFFCKFSGQESTEMELRLKDKSGSMYHCRSPVLHCRTDKIFFRYLLKIRLNGMRNIQICMNWK